MGSNYSYSVQKESVLDWNEYLSTARQMAAEGCVLLKNRNSALPLRDHDQVAVFGRIQNHYYKSGTGSGGMVNVEHCYTIPEALEKAGVSLDPVVAGIYQDWEKDHPFEEGLGWGQEPWSQEEMEITDSAVREAAQHSDTAVAIIGRTAGEDKDSTNTRGAYMLTLTELDMLKKVRKHFDRMIVLLNTGGIMDMTEIEAVDPDAVMYIWQGGMVGALGAADVLTGRVSPSGSLPDTIAEHITDYPSDDNFGDTVQNCYAEDIYVGYRYFETFDRSAVLYPFGFGLSYTDFDINVSDFIFEPDEKNVHLKATVTNKGQMPGKKTVFIYASAPQGVLGKPARVLAAFDKTGELKPGESETLTFDIPFYRLTSYDDEGVTLYPQADMMEEGVYRFYAGGDVRSAAPAGSGVLSEPVLIDQFEEALPPAVEFERLKPGAEIAGETDDDTTWEKAWEKVPTGSNDLEQRIQSHRPQTLSLTVDRGIKLQDVAEGRNSMEEFIAQLSENDLCCIVRGEGMGSSQVTPGTAAAFAGVTESLRNFGIPVLCCDDGPSGMRFDSGVRAFSLPNGTLIGSSCNMELARRLYRMLGLEMLSQKVDTLLGPGVNIHRHPLNGRNFEYFSEDPHLTGMMAGSILRGLHDSGVTGTIKHFCGNNQESSRRRVDSEISMRALREIYIKPFEIALRFGHVRSIMTSYGKLNDCYTSGNYDLCTTVLRHDLNFDGIVMTDWWSDTGRPGTGPDPTDLAAMVRAQNDIYMVVQDSSRNLHGDNLEESLKSGFITLGELQRCAMNICSFAVHMPAFVRMQDPDRDLVQVKNKPVDTLEQLMEDVEFTELHDHYEEDLTGRESVKGTSYVFAFNVPDDSAYRVTLTGSSTLGEVAQLPVTLFYNGFPVLTFTFRGSGGKDVSIDRVLDFRSHFWTLRLYVGSSGLELKNIRFDRVES